MLTCEDFRKPSPPLTPASAWLEANEVCSSVAGFKSLEPLDEINRL